MRWCQLRAPIIPAARLTVIAEADETSATDADWFGGLGSGVGPAPVWLRKVEVVVENHRIGADDGAFTDQDFLSGADADSANSDMDSHVKERTGCNSGECGGAATNYRIGRNGGMHNNTLIDNHSRTPYDLNLWFTRETDAPMNTGTPKPRPQAPEWQDYRITKCNPRSENDT